MRYRLRLILAAAVLMECLVGVVRPSLAGTMFNGSFSGTIGSITNTSFSFPTGISFNNGDAISGTFSFDPTAMLSTFTTTLTDTTSGTTFLIPSVGNTGVSVTASSTDYNISANAALAFAATNTPFTTAFLLDLQGMLHPGDLTQTAEFAAGTGSLTIFVPSEGSPSTPASYHPDETLVVPFTVSSADIPEPASIGIFGLALAGVARLRRRATV